MDFFKIFKNENEAQVKKYSDLYAQLDKEFPGIDETNLIISSCIAGLMARVAYVDFHIAPEEIFQIEKSFAEWKIHENFDSKIVTQMAINHIKEMAGLENHLYVHPLREHLSKEERYKVIQSLFLIAASDGNVESVESEEIRIICKGLELSGQHFVAARAEVAKYLGALSQ